MTPEKILTKPECCPSVNQGVLKLFLYFTIDSFRLDLISKYFLGYR
jgi:hypothetical protein